jgi:hypothetical protein
MPAFTSPAGFPFMESAIVISRSGTIVSCVIGAFEIAGWLGGVWAKEMEIPITKKRRITDINLRKNTFQLLRIYILL